MGQALRDDKEPMRFDPQAGIYRNADVVNRRRAGRFELEDVTCDLGPVLDLSSGGMRVRCRQAPSGIFPVRLCGLGGELVVRAQVAWVKRNGLFKREVGLQFLDVTPDIARHLSQMAMSSRRQRTM